MPVQPFALIGQKRCLMVNFSGFDDSKISFKGAKGQGYVSVGHYQHPEVQKLLPEFIRNTLRELKFPKFSGEACPQTPLGGLWVYAHSLIVVTVQGQIRSPTFVTCSPPMTVLMAILIHRLRHCTLLACLQLIDDHAHL